MNIPGGRKKFGKRPEALDKPAGPVKIEVK
jgi:hypothetical protein